MSRCCALVRLNILFVFLFLGVTNFFHVFLYTATVIVLLCTAIVQPYGKSQLLNYLELLTLTAIFMTLWAGNVFNANPRCEDGIGGTLDWCDTMSIAVGAIDVIMLAAAVATMVYYKKQKQCNACAGSRSHHELKEKEDNGSSPNHGAMGAAFHSVLIQRATRTRTSGKNMGAKAMVKIIAKHVIKERWEQWHQHVREIRLALHVEIRVLTVCWKEWNQCIQRQMKKKILLRRLISRHQQYNLTQGMRHWAAGTKDRQIMILRHRVATLGPTIQLHQQTIQLHQQEEKRRVMNRLVGRMMHRLVSSSFTCWFYCVQRLLNNEHIVQTMGQRIRMSCEHRAFNTW